MKAAPALGLLLVLVSAWVLPEGLLQAQTKEPVVAAVQSAGPAVVNISARGKVERRQTFSDPFFDRFFKDFFDFYPRQETQTSSLGSGVIIDGRAGYILTNHHVVEGSREVKVTLADLTELEARLVGTDPGSDLAVLKVEAPRELSTISLADSDKLLIGQSLIAIGNPFGLSHTVTTGVVSALNRTFRVEGELFFGFIQTDAAINPGNSGGALLDLEGRLVGINTAIYAQAQGIGFAIPINRARRIAAELIAHGRVRPSWLGLSIQTLTEELKPHFPVPGGRGVIVTGVDQDSPAARAGLRKDDVILRIDALPVASREGFDRAKDDYPPGQTMRLTVHRQSRTASFSLTAAEVPKERMRDLAWTGYGFRVKPMTRSRSEEWRLPPGKGLIVAQVRPGSPAGEIGLKEGDVLLALADQETDSMEGFEAILAGLDPSRPVKMIVQRHATRYLVTLTPEG